MNPVEVIRCWLEKLQTNIKFIYLFIFSWVSLYVAAVINLCVAFCIHVNVWFFFKDLHSLCYGGRKKSHK